MARRVLTDAMQAWSHHYFGSLYDDPVAAADLDRYDRRSAAALAVLWPISVPMGLMACRVPK